MILTFIVYYIKLNGGSITSLKKKKMNYLHYYKSNSINFYRIAGISISLVLDLVDETYVKLVEFLLANFLKEGK